MPQNPDLLKWLHAHTRPVRINLLLFVPWPPAPPKAAAAKGAVPKEEPEKPVGPEAQQADNQTGHGAGI